MQASFLAVYLTVALFVFLILLSAFLLDHSTPKIHRLSWVVVVLGSAFWFIVIPLSFAEVVRKVAKVKSCAQKQGNPNQKLS